MSRIAEGQVIAARYRLERPLARGGMGSVWVARHLQLGSLMAVKFMDANYAASPDARERFEREAKAAAQLQSPHVVQVHDYGIEDDTPFLVMELLEGEDLGARIKRVGRLSLTAVADILAQAARALRRAHEAGIVHRDIKPANVFLAKNDDVEVVKILDFGIAKVSGLGATSEMTKTGQLLGSPFYMSPEQARRAREVDHRSDLWALAVIAYRAITAEYPFPGEEIAQVLVAICSDPFVPASRHLPGLLPEIDRFFDRALSKDPNARFQTAPELSAAFAFAIGARVSPDDPSISGARQAVVVPQATPAAAPQAAPVAAPQAAPVAVARTAPVAAAQPAPQPQKSSVWGHHGKEDRTTVLAQPTREAQPKAQAALPFQAHKSTQPLQAPTMPLYGGAGQPVPWNAAAASAAPAAAAPVGAPVPQPAPAAPAGPAGPAPMPVAVGSKLSEAALLKGAATLTQAPSSRDTSSSRRAGVFGLVGAVGLLLALGGITIFRYRTPTSAPAGESPMAAASPGSRAAPTGAAPSESAGADAPTTAAPAIAEPASAAPATAAPVDTGDAAPSGSAAPTSPSSKPSSSKPPKPSSTAPSKKVNPLNHILINAACPKSIQMILFLYEPGGVAKVGLYGAKSKDGKSGASFTFSGGGAPGAWYGTSQPGKGFKVTKATDTEIDLGLDLDDGKGHTLTGSFVAKVEKH